MRKQPNKQLIQVAYTGMGGSTSISLSIAEHMHNVQHKLLFVGVEDLLPAYEADCIKNQIDYVAFKKKYKIDWSFIRLMRLISNQSDSTRILVHVNAVVPYLLFLSPSSKKNVFLVEHQSERSKTKMEKFYSFLSSFLRIRKIHLTPYNAKKSFSLSSDRTSVIPNGINVKTYSPKPFIDKNFNEETIVLGMASRIDNQREHEVLFLAGIELKKRGYKVLIKIAGNDLGKLTELKNLARRENFEHCIEHLGVLGKPQMIRFYHSLDIYVHATKYETLSTSILQAMSCQLPVIASNIPEIRTNFESIVNYNLGDPANLAHQIIELIQNNKLQSTGADCRKEVKLKYSLEKMVSSYHNYLWA